MTFTRFVTRKIGQSVGQWQKTLRFRVLPTRTHTCKASPEKGRKHIAETHTASSQESTARSGGLSFGIRRADGEPAVFSLAWGPLDCSAS
jgi:hypothetical protein